MHVKTHAQHLAHHLDHTNKKYLLYGHVPGPVLNTKHKEQDKSSPILTAP